jgi:hypothetical protein
VPPKIDKEGKEGEESCGQRKRHHKEGKKRFAVSVELFSSSPNFYDDVIRI